MEQDSRGGLVWVDIVDGRTWLEPVMFGEISVAFGLPLKTGLQFKMEAPRIIQILRFDLNVP